MKFKVGDRVKYIENDFSDLIKGKVYTVTKTEKNRYGSDNFVYLDTKHAAWFEYRFELVKPFKKYDLQENDKIVFANGDVDFIANNEFKEHNINNWNIDLTSMYDEDYNIIKVERPTGFTTVYERTEEKIEMTIAEIEKQLGHTIKIVKEEN